MDASEDPQHREHSDTGLNGSMGSSSSFEELDMDQEGHEEGHEEGQDEEHAEEEEEDPGVGGGATEPAELVAEKREVMEGGDE